MKCSMVAMVSALISLSMAMGAQVNRHRDTHPIENVIDLLKNLQAKVKQGQQAEQITYAKFEYWCKSNQKTLKDAIADSQATLDSGADRAASLKAQKEILEKDIEELGDEILKQTASGGKADKVRQATASLYSSANTDYDSTIKAIEDALKGLQDAHTATEASLVQSSDKSMNKEIKAKVLQALSLGSSLSTATDAQRTEITDLVLALSQSTNVTRPDFAASGDYDQHTDTYKFKSDSVIELLKDLKRKFEDEKLAANKAETNSLNAYALAKQARDEEIKQMTANKAVKESSLGDVDGEIATVQADVTAARSDLSADKASLESTAQSCSIKASEYTQRQETRNGEMEAMSQAIKVLAEVSGVRTEPPSNPVPPPSPVAAGVPTFLEIASVDPKQKAVQLLRQSAQKTHSKALERLAKQLAAHASGPFDDIINNIQKMIFRLNQEQTDEDTHKNWCDLEVNKTDASSSQKGEKMTELSLKINQAAARMADLVQEIQDDTEMVAKINAHMEESTQIRAEGKEQNEIAVKEAQDAQKALANAIAILDEFYKDSGMVAKESWEFVQQPTELTSEPSTWTSSYSGLADPTKQPSGVISVLKSIAAKFASMEAGSNAQEETDRHFYEEDMKNSKIEVARRTKEAEMKTQEKKRLVDKKLQYEEQHKHVSDEKHATDQYMTDLQKACVDGDSTYEERAAARAQEIAALKQAQVILQDAFKKKATSFLQRRM